ncbi:MAG: hypothetical protein U1E78_07180 [Gammaproteobacteria bacterium]
MDNILKIITSMPFGLLICCIAVIGRNRILKADTGFYPKKRESLNKLEKQKLKKMRLQGNLLLWICTPFLFFYGYCLIIKITNL